MNRRILSATIAASMLLSMTALSGCGSKASDVPSGASSTSDTEVMFELDSEGQGSEDASDKEDASSAEESKDSSAESKNTKSEKSASSKSAASKSAASKSAASKSAASKSSASKSASSKLTSSKSSSSKSSSEGLTDDETLQIVLDNTDYTEDELAGISENEADGDRFYNIAFIRNGTYVFYVRQRDGRFYTYEDFNKAYNEYYDGYVDHDSWL